MYKYHLLFAVVFFVLSVVCLFNFVDMWGEFTSSLLIAVLNLELYSIKKRAAPKAYNLCTRSKPNLNTGTKKPHQP